MISRSAYPYFEVNLWGGRLQAPPQIRGTAMAKRFECGAIGGKKIIQHNCFENTPADRARLLEWVRRHRGEQIDIYYIASPRHHRHRIAEHWVLPLGFVERGLAGHTHLPPELSGPMR